MTQAAAPARRSRRDRVVDLTCVTLALLVVLLWTMDVLDTGRFPLGFVWLATQVAASACALLWWRRRWPVGVALVLAPVVAVFEAAGGAVAVAVFTVAVHRGWRTTLGIAVLHAAVVVPYTIVRPDPILGTAGSNIVNVALIALVVGWGRLVRRRRRRLAALRDRAVRAEAEAAQHDDRIRGQERERIAREMHDALAHRISLVSLHAGALEVRPDLPAEEIGRTAATIRANAHLALEDLREILGVLRRGGLPGDGLQPQPGLADVAALVAEARAAGTPVDLRDALPPSAPEGLAGRTAYRVVQEGLTNARKHAPGEEVRVDLARTPAGDLHVWLRNRLLPVAPPPSGRIPGARSGLVGLAERVSLSGGRIDYGARRGDDGLIAFHLEAWLPWPS
jgi:signal transduction histidine kinase